MSAYESDHIDDVIEGFARCAWALAFADEHENAGEPLSQCEILDVAPDTPPAIEMIADRITLRFSDDDHKRIDAIVAEGGDAVELGHYLCLEAQGHGAAWSDDNPPHGLNVGDLADIAFEAYQESCDRVELAPVLLQASVGYGSGEVTDEQYDGEISARICAPEVESGYKSTSRAPLSWFNSARVEADGAEDSVTAYISIGDPRGAFAFTLRRLPDGRIIMHVPHEGMLMAHAPLKKLHDGTFEVG